MEHIINAKYNPTMIYPEKEKININDVLIFNSTADDGSPDGTYHCWHVPFNCRVRISATGARGGNGSLGLGGFSDSRRGGYGAQIIGEFILQKNDDLLMLVGVGASHASTSVIFWANCVSGAGGGGTFVTRRLRKGTNKYQFIGNGNQDTSKYTGWYIEPLIVAAGGNGGHDHSSFAGGPNGQYNGMGRTMDDEHLPTSDSNVSLGGGFSIPGSIPTDSTDGQSFLRGGKGSTRYSERYLVSKAGFGGGGANEETIGGGAGGWIPGSRNSPAYSWISSEGIFVEEHSNWNDQCGVINITILEILPDINSAIFANNKFNEAALNEDGRIFANGKYNPIKTTYVKTASGIWKPLA